MGWQEFVDHPARKASEVPCGCSIHNPTVRPENGFSREDWPRALVRVEIWTQHQRVLVPLCRECLERFSYDWSYILDRVDLLDLDPDWEVLPLPHTGTEASELTS